MQAVGKAFNTWAEAGVGLEFTEVELNQDPDIVVDWRAAFCADEGFSMIGSPVAHSDGPIGCSIIPTAVELHEKRNALPKPIHFDQEETRWGLEWGTEGEGRIPIEDAAVHEIGHFLGLDHSEANPPPGYVIDPPPGNVMHPTLGWSGRTLGPDDLFNIGRAYPPLRNWISSFKSDLILDVVASSQDNGAKIQQSRPRGSSLFSFNPNQRFRVEKVGQPQGFPEYRIIAVHSGKVLDVDWDFRFPTANGAQVQQWDWHGGPNQRFRVRPERMDSRGTVYRIIAVHSGKVLDVDLNSPTPDGARIQQWDWLGGDNQLWRFI